MMMILLLEQFPFSNATSQESGVRLFAATWQLSTISPYPGQSKLGDVNSVKLALSHVYVISRVHLLTSSREISTTQITFSYRLIKAVSNR